MDLSVLSLATSMASAGVVFGAELPDSALSCSFSAISLRVGGQIEG